MEQTDLFNTNSQFFKAQNKYLDEVYQKVLQHKMGSGDLILNSDLINLFLKVENFKHIFFPAGTGKSVTLDFFVFVIFFGIRKLLSQNFPIASSNSFFPTQNLIQKLEFEANAATSHFFGSFISAEQNPRTPCFIRPIILIINISPLTALEYKTNGQVTAEIRHILTGQFHKYLGYELTCLLLKFFQKDHCPFSFLMRSIKALISLVSRSMAGISNSSEYFKPPKLILVWENMDHFFLQLEALKNSVAPSFYQLSGLRKSYIQTLQFLRSLSVPPCQNSYPPLHLILISKTYPLIWEQNKIRTLEARRHSCHSNTRVMMSFTMASLFYPLFSKIKKMIQYPNVLAKANVFWVELGCIFKENFQTDFKEEYFRTSEVLKEIIQQIQNSDISSECKKHIFAPLFDFSNDGKNKISGTSNNFYSNSDASRNPDFSELFGLDEPLKPRKAPDSVPEIRFDSSRFSHQLKDSRYDALDILNRLDDRILILWSTLNLYAGYFPQLISFKRELMKDEGLDEEAALSLVQDFFARKKRGYAKKERIASDSNLFPSLPKNFDFFEKYANESDRSFQAESNCFDKDMIGYLIGIDTSKDSLLGSTSGECSELKFLERVFLNEKQERQLRPFPSDSLSPVSALENDINTFFSLIYSKPVKKQDRTKVKRKISAKDKIKFLNRKDDFLGLFSKTGVVLDPKKISVFFNFLTENKEAEIEKALRNEVQSFLGFQSKSERPSLSSDASMLLEPCDKDDLENRNRYQSVNFDFNELDDFDIFNHSNNFK